MAGERYAVELVANTLRWLLDQQLDALHPGLRRTLIGARTQMDAALKLLPHEGEIT